MACFRFTAFSCHPPLPPPPPPYKREISFTSIFFFFITTIIPLFIYRLGIIAPGDQVLCINGTNTSGMAASVANDLIRNSWEVFKLSIKKDEDVQGKSITV